MYHMHIGGYLQPAKKTIRLFLRCALCCFPLTPHPYPHLLKEMRLFPSSDSSPARTHATNQQISPQVLRTIRSPVLKGFLPVPYCSEHDSYHTYVRFPGGSWPAAASVSGGSTAFSGIQLQMPCDQEYGVGHLSAACGGPITIPKSMRKACSCTQTLQDNIHCCCKCKK